MKHVFAFVVGLTIAIAIVLPVAIIGSLGYLVDGVDGVFISIFATAGAVLIGFIIYFVGRDYLENERGFKF